MRLETYLGRLTWGRVDEEKGEYQLRDDQKCFGEQEWDINLGYWTHMGIRETTERINMS